MSWNHCYRSYSVVMPLVSIKYLKFFLVCSLERGSVFLNYFIILWLLSFKAISFLPLVIDPNPATGVQEVPHKLPLSLMLGFCYVLPQGSYGHIPTCTVSPANIGAVSASFTLMRWTKWCTIKSKHLKIPRRHGKQEACWSLGLGVKTLCNHFVSTTI